MDNLDNKTTPSSLNDDEEELKLLGAAAIHCPPTEYSVRTSAKVDGSSILCQRVNAQTVLWYLTFFGFAINYMIRINMNITIVKMVERKPEFKLREYDMLNTSRAFPITKSSSSQPFSVERLILDTLQVNYPKDGFSWHEKEQGTILGSFFWLHWLTQIPGGVLARRYGTKLVFGLSNLIGCVMCLIMPMAAYLDYRLLIAMRVLQGLICGLAWPSMHLMTARWIPPNERSKFVTAYLGSSVGVAIFYPIFGFVIGMSCWEWVYHLSAFIGIVWWMSWHYLVFDSPALHPRISVNERRRIEEALGRTVDAVGQTASIPTPWKSILCSRPVWIIAIAQWGGVWGLFTLMTQAPTYFRTIHGWNMSITGLLSGLPHLLRMLFALVFSLFGDYLLKADHLSRTNVRKLAGTFSMIVGGAFVVGLAYAGNNNGLAITMFMAATAVHGAVSTGPLASLVDLSPNYSGITLGLTGVIAVLPGFISPLIVGHLTMNNQTSKQWELVFEITAGMMIVCGVIYVLFSSSELQKWNTPPAAARVSSTRSSDNINPDKGPKESVI